MEFAESRCRPGTGESSEGYRLHAHSAMGRGGAQLGKALKGAGVPKKELIESLNGNANGSSGTERYQQEKKIQCGLRHRLEMMVEEGRHNERVSRRHSTGKWRQILRHTTAKHLRQEIGFDFFQEIRKAESLHLGAFQLVQYLKQVDHQTRTAHSRGGSQIEYLTQLYNRHMMSMNRAFESLGNRLRARMEQNADDLQRSHHDAVAKARSSMADLWADESARSTFEMQAFETERESMRNRHLEVIHMIEVTDERSHEFAALKTSDRRLTEQIERHVASIDRVSSAIQHWRKALARATSEGRASLDALQDERNHHYKSYQDLYAKFRDIRQRETSSLTRCSSKARDNVRRLRAALDTCQRVLKIATVVAKAQTEEEAGSRRTIYEQISQAQVDIIESKKRRDVIRKENEYLRSMIAKYADAIKVGPNAVEGPNPLVIVNGRSGVHTGLPPRKYRPTVVDAGLLARIYTMQTAEV